MANPRKVAALAIGISLLATVGVLVAAKFALRRVFHSLDSQPVMGGDVMINQAGGSEKVLLEAKQMFARFKAESYLLSPDELDRFPAFSAMSTQFVTVDVTVTPRTEKAGVIVVGYGTHEQREYIYIFQDDQTNSVMAPTGTVLIHPQIFVSKKSG